MTPVASPLDVWIDADCAIGVPESDVDDAFALVQAFHSPELAVRGVSATFGNAPLERTLPLAREVVARFGPAGVAVAAGAASKADLGGDLPAVGAIAAALVERPLSILALGPVTTIATLLQRRPELVPRVREIVCVAGRRRGQCFHSTPAQPEPFPDFNFECDPAAMRVLLESPIALTLAPWEVSSQVWLTAADLDALAASGAAGAYLAAGARAWLALWQERFRADGFNPFDTLAVAWLTHPELIEHLEVRLAIEPDPERPDGPPLLVAEPGGAAGRRARYCARPDRDFKALLLARLAASGARP
jgi:inosine-uridine nucleoside N-ribohydrolase